MRSIPEIPGSMKSLMRMSYGPFVRSSTSALSASLHDVTSYGPRPRIVVMSVQITGSSSATRTRQAMRDASGIDLIAQLRQNRATSRMPVVMISGHSNYAIGERAREAGANAFLNKPFTALQLRTVVQQLLTDPLSVTGT